MKRVNIELEDNDYIRLKLLVDEGRYDSVEEAVIATIKGLLSNFCFPELGDDISHLPESMQREFKDKAQAEIVPDDGHFPFSPFFLEDEEERAHGEAVAQAWEAYEKARALTWEAYGSRGARDEAVAQAEEVYLKAKAQAKKEAS